MSRQRYQYEVIESYLEKLSAPFVSTIPRTCASPCHENQQNNVKFCHENQQNNVKF